MSCNKVEDDAVAREEEAEIRNEASEKVAANALTALGSSARKEEEDDDDDEMDFEIPQRFTKSGRKRAVPFSLKLMKVLSTKEFEDIIAWMPSGKSFSILKPKAFVAQILPEHFKSAKYSSFTRKLHRWGFMRHYRGDESGAFYHKDFEKDRMDLVEKMTCHKAEPPKAPLARKAQPKPVEKAVAPALPALPVQRIMPRPSSVQKPVPVPQPREIVARLQQQLNAPELGAAERLNAAIEAEVTRRLKERIQAAAMSRHALAVMQHQFNPPAPARQQWNLAAGGLQAQLLQMQHQKSQLNSQLGLDSSCLAMSTGYPRMEARGLEELPRTNIQGAKTA